jgi:hypothetical protein
MDKVTALFNEIFEAFMRTLRFGVGLIGRMSPQALLGAALVLAFICSILPLALVLFAVFLLLKLAVGACVIGKRRARRTRTLNEKESAGTSRLQQRQEPARHHPRDRRNRSQRVVAFLRLAGTGRMAQAADHLAAAVDPVGVAVPLHRTGLGLHPAVAGLEGAGRRQAQGRAGSAQRRVACRRRKHRTARGRSAHGGLQAQVEPHFLFNTLALIGQLIETDPPQAARIHQNLIDYLRATLPQMRAKGAGTLGRQIEMSRAYLAIMQARMRSRLAVSIDVPQEMPAPPSR